VVKTSKAKELPPMVTDSMGSFEERDKEREGGGFKCFSVQGSETMSGN
jgi:hypothetical protein